MIERILISVSDKQNLKELLDRFYKINSDTEILASSGTARKIDELGYPVTRIEEYIGIGEAPNGLVKTLHPKIHGGILLHRDIPEHKKFMEENEILHIDGVIINFYPFEKVSNETRDYERMIDNIDIGGPAAVRAAAKASLKYRDMNRKKFVIIDKMDYPLLIKQIDAGLSKDFVVKMALKAFHETMKYDYAIWKHLRGGGL